MTLEEAMRSLCAHLEQRCGPMVEEWTDEWAQANPVAAEIIGRELKAPIREALAANPMMPPSMACASVVVQALEESAGERPN